MSDFCETPRCYAPLGHSGAHHSIDGMRFGDRATMSSEQCDTSTCVRPLGHSGWHKDETGYFELENDVKVAPKDRKPVNDQPTGTGEFDAVARPQHYNAQVPPTDKHPQGIECIDVIMHFDTPRGSAMKYLWRAGQKGDYIEDLDKAIAFIEFAKYKEQQRRNRA